MALEIVDHGTDNRVEIDPDVMETSSGSLVIQGSGTVVRIGSGCTLTGASLALGGGCSLIVGENSRLAALEIMAASGGTVAIGARTNFTWHTRLLLHEPGRLSIGSGCLIASETLMTISDMHSILDRRTGLRINPAADIVIEDEVWIAHAVMVLKGVRIGAGSIVGTGSIVSRDIPPRSLAVGRPACVIRDEVGWDAALL